MNQSECPNCRRSKLQVAARRDADMTMDWAQARWCLDCNDNRCGDYDLESSCQVPQMYDPAAGYLGFCPKHYRERFVCPKHKCGKPKQPWQPLCSTCEERVQERERRARVKQWRREGRLCPDCKQAPQRGPQMYCKACLEARGLPVLEPITGPWLTFVQSLHKRRKGEAMSATYRDRREALRQYAKKRARVRRYLAKRKAKLERQAKRERAKAKITDL